MSIIARIPIDFHNGADYAKRVELRDIIVSAECPYCDATQTVRLLRKHLAVNTQCFKCESWFNVEVTGIKPERAA